MIPVLFFITLFTIAEAYRDFKYIDSGVNIFHKEGAAVRVIVFATASVISNGLSIKTGLMFLSLAFYFWILFDVSLNFLRRLPVLYIGKSSEIDKFFYGKPIAMIIAKFSLFATTYLLYLLI